MSQYYPIILQLGSRFLRVGFAGDATPTLVRRTNYHLSDAQLAPLAHGHGMDIPGADVLWSYDLSSVDMDQLEALLERIIHSVYKSDLLVNPTLCKVLVLDPCLSPIPLKKVITRVLLFHMHAQSIRFIPESVMSSVASGSHCSLVIDMGWQMTSVMPVFDMRELFIHHKQTRRAGCWLHDTVRQGMEKLGLQPSFEFVERFIIESMYCDVDNTRTGEYTFDGIVLPQDLRYAALEEVIFSNSPCQDDDTLPISQLVQQVISSLDIDLRPALSKRVIITGGLSNIPGVKTRLLYEIEKLVPVQGIKTLGAWQGASLYCSTALMTTKARNELTRDKYLSGESELEDWLDRLHK